MISPQARDSLERLVEHGLRDALQPPGAAPLDIRRGDTLPPARAIGPARLVLLMIASHGFRMVLACSFPDSPAVRAWLAGLGRMAEDGGFPDAIAETGNLCCGTINRELGRHFSHTGMSTPQLIDHRSAPHVAGLRHQLQRHYEVVLEPGCALWASVSVDAHEPMHFDWWPEAEPEATGELEFF